MADTVDINAEGDAATSAVDTKVVEENAVESTETVVTPETSTNDAADETNQKPDEEASAENAAVKRKAEDTNDDVDESKKSKVDEEEVAAAAENGHSTNGHTEEQPTDAIEETPAAVEETPVVESTEDLPDVPSKTVEDVERLKAAAEENVAA